MECRKEIFAKRLNTWDTYYSRLRPLEVDGRLKLPRVPPECTHNSHIFYIRIPSAKHFEKLAALAKAKKVGVFTHYLPLHLSKGGKKYGRVSGDLTEAVACESELYRLPMWTGLTPEQIDVVVALVYDALDSQES